MNHEPAPIVLRAGYIWLAEPDQGQAQAEDHGLHNGPPWPGMLRSLAMAVNFWPFYRARNSNAPLDHCYTELQILSIPAPRNRSAHDNPRMTRPGVGTDKAFGAGAILC
jgi:hypothetical protein